MHKSSIDKDSVRYGSAQTGRYEWRSTGLYVQAAQKVKYTVPAEVAGQMKVTVWTLLWYKLYCKEFFIP